MLWASQSSNKIHVRIGKSEIAQVKFKTNYPWKKWIMAF